MKKPIHLFLHLPINQARKFFAALLLLVLMGIGESSQAQMYYIMTGGGTVVPKTGGGSTITAGATELTAGDALYKIGYTGSDESTVASQIAYSPYKMEIDGNNNRVFILDALNADKNRQNNIKVYNLKTGAYIRTLEVSPNVTPNPPPATPTVPTNNLRGLKYDPRTDYLYFINEGGDGTKHSENDKIARIRADGTGGVELIASPEALLNPYDMQLDMKNNRLIVFQSNFAARKLFFIDLDTKAVTSRSFGGSYASIYSIAYDEDEDFIYYAVADGAGTKTAVGDMVRRQKSDGTRDTVLVAGIAENPINVRLDLGNKRIFVNSGYYATARILSITLPNFTVSTIKQFEAGTFETSNSFPALTDFSLPRRAQLTTAAVTAVTATSATVGGTLVFGYGLNTERGIVYSTTNQVPVIGAGTKVSVATSTDNGTFSSGLTGLNPSTKYYVRSYTVNDAGTSYGDVTSFSTTSNNANLSTFIISAGTLSPAFASGTNSYTANVTYDKTTITVTPAIEQANATIKVNNVAVTTGSATGAISLNPGSNTITTVVTAQDGTTTKTYTTTITKDKTPQVITFSALNAKNYGDADFTLGAVAGSTLAVTYTSDNNNVATVSNTGAVHIVGTGTVNITAAQAGNTTYLAAPNVIQQLIVNKAVLTYTADTRSRSYGASNPAFTGSISGFVNSDTQASATTGTMVFTSTATATSNTGGQYPITGSGLSAANYSFTQAAGNNTALSIGKITLTYTAQPATKVYGAANPSFTVVFTGFANGEAIGGITSGITYSTTATATSGVGSYPITVSGLSATNYDFTPAAGNTTAFSITKANLTFTANTVTRKYGEANPALVGTIAGFVNTDKLSDLTGTAVYASTATATSGVGSYPITLSGLSSPNYNIVAVAANNTALSVTKNTLKYLATAASRAFNTSPEPAITGTITGFLNSDTQASATTGTLSFSTSVTASSPVGSYAINGAGLSSGNYDIVQDAANASAFSIYNSNNGYLSNLTLSDGTLSPVFAQTTNNYTATVATNVTSITITPTLSDIVNARLTVNGQSVTSGSGYTVSSLNVGPNTITINVTAQDGVTRVPYSLTVTRLPSSDATLSNLAMTNGTLGAPNSYDVYSSTIANSVTSVDITAIVNEPNATIAIDNNISLTSGTPYSIPVNVGQNIHNIFVTAQDGKTAHVYGLNITRAYSSNNLLSSLVVGSGTLSPAFDSNTETYSIALPNATKSVDFSASVVDNTANFYIDGHYAAANEPITIDLAVGTTPITMRVVAQDGSVKNYTVNVTRAASTDATLSSLGILTTIGAIETFDANSDTYNTTVSSDVTQFRVRPVAANDGASITVNGVPLDNYNGNAYTMKYFSATEPQTIVVTAGDGVTQKTYTINVVRQFNTNNLLQSLTLNFNGTLVPLNPVFDPAVNDYTLVINDPNVTNVVIAPVPQNNAAYLRVGGVPVNIGSSRYVPLQGGANIIPVSVEAVGGGFNIYNINITRAYSSDAGLINVIVSGNAGYSSIINQANNNLTATAPNSVTAVALIPNASDPGGTVITVNGYAISDGASGSLPLAVGDNVFTVGITAADNSNTQYYTVHVNRLPFVDVSLSSLAVSKGTLTPAFTPGTLNYSVLIGSADQSVDITALASLPVNTVTIGAGTVTPANPTYTQSSTFSGSQNVSITVRAPDGINFTRYRLTVVHPAGNQALLGGIQLSQGTVSPAFSRTIDTYTASVPYSASSIAFMPQSAEANGHITITTNGNNTVVGPGNSAVVSLNVGANVISTTVASPDNSSSKTYTVTVTRGVANTDGALASLNVSDGTLSPAFDSGTTSYIVNVNYATTQISVFPKATSTLATVKIGMAPVSTGLTVPLNVGRNTITTTVTAEDGTEHPYIITVNRSAIGVDATLASLGLSDGTLSPVFDAATNTYTAAVDTATNVLSISPLTTDPYATVKVNDADVDLTTGLIDVPLNLGSNIIAIVVTAQNGTDTKSYQLTVTRALQASADASLSSLAISPGTLSPVFDANTTAYNAGTVASESIKITATLADTTATLKINGNDIYANSALSVPLVAGSNTISIKTKAQDSTTVKEYTITVNRTVPAAPTLSYAGPQTFTNGVTIASPVTPTSTGVDPVGGYTAAKTTVSAEVANPTGITRDGAGNLYVAGFNGIVYKLPAAGGAAVPLNTNALQNIFNLTVDAAGNVYAAALGEQDIQKIPAAGGATTPITVGAAGNSGVAVDAVGNVYVTNVINSTLTKISVDGVAELLSDDFSGPYGVVADTKGNLYVNSYDGTIKTIKTVGGTLTTLASGLGASVSMAIDADGSNLYIAGANIVKVPTNGDTPATVGDGFSQLFGVATGDAGELFVTDNGISQVQKISPVGGYFISPALPAGLTFDKNTGAIGGKPTALATAADYTVTGYNSGGKVQATVNIKVIAPDATLVSLSTTGSFGVQHPTAGAYTTNLSYSTGTIRITPVSTDPNAVIRVDGNTVASGSASAVITPDAAAGSVTTVPIVVTTADGSATQSYTLTITRGQPGSQTAKIKSIQLVPASTLTLVAGPVSADPSNPAPVTYTTSVAAGVSSVSVKTFVLEAHSTITVEGVPVANEALSAPVTLNAGTTTIHISVTAQDGITTKTFMVIVSKSGSSNANLASIQLSPTSILSPSATGTANVNYTSSVNSATTQVRLTPIAEDAGATIRVAGNITSSGTASVLLPLNATGTTTIRTEVTAGDGSSKRTYDVTISKNGSSNVKILSLQLSPAAILTQTSTGTADVNYTTSVHAGVSSVTLTPILADISSRVKVNNVTVKSGTASGAITLNATGVTMISVEVTGQDGVTKRTNSIAVSRTGSSNVKLSTLAITPASTLTQITGGTAGAFQTSVTAGTTSITVIPTAEDATSVIRVEGTIVQSGNASAPITLNAGTATTLVHVTVTGQDNITIRNYSILVYKNGSSYVKLQSIRLNPASTLTVAETGTADVNYTTSVAAGTTSVKLTPVAFDVTGTIRVEGVITPSGTASAAILLNTGNAPTTVNLTVTGQDNQTVKTYAIVISKNGSSDVDLKSISLNPAASLTATTGTATVNYTTSVATGTTTVTVTPTANNPNAVIKVEGTIVQSGTASNPITLNGTGTTMISLEVKGQDNQTVRTYSIAVSKSGSSVAKLKNVVLTPASPVTVSGRTYSAGVGNGQATIKVTPYITDDATVTVNSHAVNPGTASADIALATGQNSIVIVVTAQDGTTTNSYTLQVTRDTVAPSFNSVYTTGIAPKSDIVTTNGVTVHQAVSPNGDGQNDVLNIEGIENYTDNHLSIMNTGGQLIFETRSYNTTGNVFDGHSNKTGIMQKPGTYYYSLEYKDGNDTKRKTGYIILKY